MPENFHADPDREEIFISMRCPKDRMRLSYDGQFTWCVRCAWELDRQPTMLEIVGARFPQYTDTAKVMQLKLQL